MNAAVLVRAVPKYLIFSTLLKDIHVLPTVMLCSVILSHASFSKLWTKTLACYIKHRLHRCTCIVVFEQSLCHVSGCQSASVHFTDTGSISGHSLWDL